MKAITVLYGGKKRGEESTVNIACMLELPEV